MVNRLKLVGLAFAAACLAALWLGQGVARAGEGVPKTALAVLENGSAEMGSALADLGKGDVEGATASSGRAFENLLQTTGGEGSPAGVLAQGTGSSGCSAAEGADGKGCFQGLKRYLKGAAVGGSVGGTIGAVAGSAVGYLGAKDAVDYIRMVAAFFGIPESMLGNATAGLLYGTAFGGAVGAVMGAAGGAITGAAILGYSPIREGLVKAGRFIKRLASSAGDSK